MSVFQRVRCQTCQYTLHQCIFTYVCNPTLMNLQLITNVKHQSSRQTKDVIHPRTCGRTDPFHSVSPSSELPSGLTLRKQRAARCNHPPAHPVASHPWRHPARTACPIIPLTSANRSIWEASWEMLHVNSDLFFTGVNPSLLSCPPFPSLYIHTLHIYICPLI